MKRKELLLIIGAVVILVGAATLLGPLAPVSVELQVPDGVDATYAQTITGAISNLLVVGLPLLMVGCLAWVAFHLWRKSRRPPQ